MSLRLNLRTCYAILAFLLICTPFRIATASPSLAKPLSAADIIAQINNYRGQNGLPAYQINSKLMLSAQGQSDYQASIGSVTHTGLGGSSARDRAYAVGYGDGNTIWISEIIYGGSSATVDTALTWWKNSQIHNDTMLSTRYKDIGAGVASSGSKVYFTAVMGYIVDGSSTDGSPDTGSEPDNDDQPPEILIIPVVAAEPGEDGSIVHVVRTGQSLWNISAVYHVSKEELLALNDFIENEVIYPGQEILVRPPQVEEQATIPAAQIIDSDHGVETQIVSEPIPPTTVNTPQSRIAVAPESTIEHRSEAGPSGLDEASESPPHTAEGLNVNIGTAALTFIALFTLVLLFVVSLRPVDETEDHGH